MVVPVVPVPVVPVVPVPVPVPIDPPVPVLELEVPAEARLTRAATKAAFRIPKFCWKRVS